jgi:hypothetical protein
MEELNNAELLLLECGEKTDINGVAGKPLAAVVKVEVLKIAHHRTGIYKFGSEGVLQWQLCEPSEVLRST